MPKVSVLMPAYNSEKYIAEAIDSILNQTFTDFEFIIINDGSTDNTAKIIRNYARKDLRIRFINNRQNRGFIKRLNDCLDLASGEYVAKMDSDDISLPTRLEKQVEFLDSHPDIGMVGCGLQAFDKGDFIKTHPAKIGLVDALIEIPTTIFMARRSLIEQNKLRFNPDFIACEDYEFYAQFIKHANIANIPDVLYKYRWHGNNISIKKRDIQSKNTKLVQQELAQHLTYNIKMQKNLLWLCTESNTHVKLFGIIPIIRIKRYGINKTKYYLFEKIPLLRVQDEKIYLFEFIKIGKIK